LFDKISNTYCAKTEEEGAAMIEFLGLAISCIGVGNDLLNTKHDRETWKDEEWAVNGQFLEPAIKAGLVTGAMDSFRWVSEDDVLTRELERTHQVVFAYNDEKKIRYRIVRGRRGERKLVLMQKIVTLSLHVAGQK
jgi:hypothetical protein